MIALVAATAAGSMFGYQRRVASRPSTGSLAVESSPAGLDVAMGGKDIGKTPLTLSLAPGTYEIQIGAPGQQRTIQARVSAGIASVQHVEFVPAPPPPPVAESAGLRVTTEPSPLAVLVDGVQRGQAPVVVENLAPGSHDVAIRTERGLVHKTVALKAGENLSLLLSGSAPAAPGPAPMPVGWLWVASAVPMQLREGGKVIGTTESDRLLLPAGDHNIEFVNESLGFRSNRKITVVAGKATSTRVDLPNGTLSVNAQPWAEVWIDGERVGETPIGNLQRPIGPHQVIFRHPDLGERRESVVITLLGPARLGVDLRKK